MQQSSIPVIKDLVLIGGGHAHVGVLRRLGMQPVPGLRVTLLARDIDTPYSGMLPGLIAGHYTHRETHIDLRPLCGFAGARLYHTEVVGLDLQRKQVLVEGRPPVRFDVLSINTGSRPTTGATPGAAEHAIAVKSIDRFLRRWEQLQQRVLASTGRFEVAVVGGGAGGVEVLLAAQCRLAEQLRNAGDDPNRLSYSLFTAEAQILSSHAAGVRRRFEKVLQQRGVALHCGARVASVDENQLTLVDGALHLVDAVLWLTHAAAPEWPGEAGLAVDAQGFIQVDEYLRSVSHPYVFAAGDVASMPDPRPKSGVFAVRQGPFLHHNLLASSLGKPLRKYRPQKHFLGLISTGDKNAVASRGRWSAQGPWLWTWKDHIDRRFMQRFNELPKMPEPQAPKFEPGLGDAQTLQVLAQTPMRCGGCGAKVGASVLTRVLQDLPSQDQLGPAAQLCMEGLNQPDDAALIEVPSGHLLVQSVDFFRAFIDDPFTLGAIAANHALGDVYAMGARAHSALALAVVPYALESEIEQTLRDLLMGALQTLQASGAVLLGGHSGEGAELAFGLSVNGLVTPGQSLRKQGLRPGQQLVLTKPLGTGTLLAADMRQQARGSWIEGAIEQMLVSNQQAAVVLRAHGATACTDVTGFGLLGHLMEMLNAADLGAELSLDGLPVLEGALETLAGGIVSSLQASNLRLRRALRAEAAHLKHPTYPLLFDPQTAGGLLAGVEPPQLTACLEQLRSAGYQACTIGQVCEPVDSVVRVRLVSA